MTTKQQRTAAKLAKLKRNADIMAMYAAGTEVRTIATTLDSSQTTIFRVLRENGIQLKENRHFTDATISRAIELYLTPENSIKYILEETGIKSEQTLYRYLKECNVPLRNSIEVVRSEDFKILGLNPKINL